MGDVTVEIPGWLVIYLLVCAGIVMLLDAVKVGICIYEWRAKRRKRPNG